MGTSAESILIIGWEVSRKDVIKYEKGFQKDDEYEDECEMMENAVERLNKRGIYLHLIRNDYESQEDERCYISFKDWITDISINELNTLLNDKRLLEKCIQHVGFYNGDTKEPPKIITEDFLF